VLTVQTLDKVKIAKMTTSSVEKLHFACESLRMAVHIFKGHLFYFSIIW